jgi:hypothetical protein
MDINHTVITLPKQPFFHPVTSQLRSFVFAKKAIAAQPIQWRGSPRFTPLLRIKNREASDTALFSTSKDGVGRRRDIALYQSNPGPTVQLPPSGTRGRSRFSVGAPNAHMISFHKKDPSPASRQSSSIIPSSNNTTSTVPSNKNEGSESLNVLTSLNTASIVASSPNLSASELPREQTRTSMPTSLSPPSIQVPAGHDASISAPANAASHSSGTGRPRTMRATGSGVPKFITSNRSPALTPRLRRADEPESTPRVPGQSRDMDQTIRGSLMDKSDSADPGGGPSARSVGVSGELWLDTLSLRDWINSFLSDGLQRAVSGRMME